MLDRSSTSVNYHTVGVPVSLRLITTIAAQNIAKAHRPACARVVLGALWADGLLEITDRTAALAATIFGCSQGSIGRARAELDAVPVSRTELLVHHWHHATPAERAAFGRAIGVDVVWDSAVAPNLT